MSTVVLTKYFMDFAWLLNMSSVNVALLTNLEDAPSVSGDIDKVDKLLRLGWN